MKFQIGDRVRVSQKHHYCYGKEGEIIEIRASGHGEFQYVETYINGKYYTFIGTTLKLISKKQEGINHPLTSIFK